MSINVLLQWKYCSILSIADHYAQLGEYSVIQQLVLSLDPNCLDIHQVSLFASTLAFLALSSSPSLSLSLPFFLAQVVEMCWSHRLYDAMIYVYNNGLKDYITPLLVSYLASQFVSLVCV